MRISSLLPAAFLVLLALAAVLALSGCSPLRLLNGVIPHDGFERQAGIAYGEGERRRLDVYVPKGAGPAPRPVIVFFYGGSWKGGDRANYLFVAEALTARGFVVVIPDYRVYPEVRYPGFVEDGAKAVAWTRREIARFHGDASRLYVMGHSAGSLIAAMLAYNDRFLKAEGMERSDIRGLIGLAGPYDFKPVEPDIEAILSGKAARPPRCPRATCGVASRPRCSSRATRTPR